MQRPTRTRTFRGQLLQFSLSLVGILGFLSLVTGLLLYLVIIPEFGIIIENKSDYLRTIFVTELEIPAAVEDKQLIANKVAEFASTDPNFGGVALILERGTVLISEPQSFASQAQKVIQNIPSQTVAWDNYQFVSWSPIVVEGLNIGKLIVAHSGSKTVMIVSYFFAFLILQTTLILISIWISIRFSRRLVEPIKKATKFAAQIGDGNFDQQIDAQQDMKEIRDLIDHMNHMATQLANKQSALVEARIEAEAASDVKTRFLANMSHEMRTPLNGVLGITESLMDSDQAKSIQEDLQIIYSSAKCLLDIIEDVLDISKIESGAISVECIKCNLADILRNAVLSVLPQARQKDLPITIELGIDVPQWIQSDPVRVRQIILNLLSNAIKFSDKGEVKLSVQTQDKSMLKIAVSDEGIGMTESQLQTVFSAFRQADVSITRKFGGTGLGLTISRSLAQLLGGDLCAESIYQQGSTFTLTIPSPISSRRSKKKYRKYTYTVFGTQKFIDNMKLRLDDAGARYTSNIIDAEIILIGEVPDDQSYYKNLTQQLYTVQRNFSTIIGIPQISRWGSNHPFYSLGVNSVLLEPVFIGELFELKKVITEPNPLTEQPSLNFKGNKILVAEDNPVNQKVITRALTQLGIEVLVAPDGAKAVEILSSTPDIQLVFMDLQMPIMDGLQATKKIRSFLPEIPIIALTADAISDASKRCFDVGMNDFLTKPLRRKILSEKLNEYLSSSDQ